jgi:hypothetical protein
MTPTVTVGSAAWNSPNGLPSAIAHSPTNTSSLSEREVRERLLRLHLDERDVALGVAPHEPALHLAPSGKETVMTVAFPATWSFVTM